MKNVVIIGSNIAGLNCGLNLDLKKFSVIIIDKSTNPGTKVCAGGVSGKADAYIPNRFYERHFNKIVIDDGKYETAINREHRPIHILDRVAYVNYMITKAKKKGIKIILGKEIKLENIKKDHIKCNNKKLKYDLLIGADGYDSIIRKKLKLKSKYLTVIEAKTKKKYNELKVIIDAKLMGYFWIFPHKRFSSIGCGMNVKEFKPYCENLGIKYYDVKGAKIQYHYEGYEFGNTYLAGEAAGFTSELTGEGIYYSLISGIELAKELNTGIKSERLKKMLKKLKIQKLHLGIPLYLLIKLLIRFKMTRHFIGNMTEKLSVK